MAKIVKLPKPIPHPNAERLEGFVINGNRVWYGKDLLKEGNFAIYFPIECQINPVILSRLNLFSDKTLNVDNNVSGYFGHQGRVKAIKLRGEPSEGFILPIRQFDEGVNSYLSILDLEERIDQEFDTVTTNGIETWVCKKYVPEAARNSGTGPRPKKNISDIIIDGQFVFHYNTPKLKENINKLEYDDIITITYKMHGTSAVFANVLTKRKLNWKERIAKWFGAKVIETEYGKVYSSRSIIKYVEDKYRTQKDGFYSSDVWAKTFEVIKDSIDKGITLYGEIVGYDSNSKMIQKGYDYGQVPGFSEFYVYRITHTTEEGKVYEFDWDQIKDYCRRNDLKHVPELFCGTVKQYYTERQLPEPYNPDAVLKQLELEFLERPCHLCKNEVPAEGIVVRKEGHGYPAWKLKSYSFLMRESAQLDAGEVDIETQESI